MFIAVDNKTLVNLNHVASITRADKNNISIFRFLGTTGSVIGTYSIDTAAIEADKTIGIINSFGNK
ncbi:hypothetical protein [Undibacterium sp. TS12]|uniref:hypothetical protein n=1 Tax=Undibacterium sp. TS12 TaxID=2908202 RepID=UPI001F4D0195|nr:hypothetical protein [Undibacterium sp. TS12]MCH8619756.1 hypothetical protein [Undibacterium sp. TS12]